MLTVCLYSLFTGEDKGKEKHFTDKDICKPFLLGICISDLFVNTVRPHDSPYTLYMCLWVGVAVEEYFIQTVYMLMVSVTYTVHTMQVSRLQLTEVKQGLHLHVWEVNDHEVYRFNFTINPHTHIYTHSLSSVLNCPSVRRFILWRWRTSLRRPQRSETTGSRRRSMPTCSHSSRTMRGR